MLVRSIGVLIRGLLLFINLWPFLIVVAICTLVEWITNTIKFLNEERWIVYITIPIILVTGFSYYQRYFIHTRIRRHGDYLYMWSKIEGTCKQQEYYFPVKHPKAKDMKWFMAPMVLFLSLGKTAEVVDFQARLKNETTHEFTMEINGVRHYGNVHSNRYSCKMYVPPEERKKLTSKQLNDLKQRGYNVLPKPIY